MGFASAAAVPSILGMVASKAIMGGSKGGGGGAVASTPAPAPAAPDAAVATRAAQMSQRAAGASPAPDSVEDGMTAPKERAAKRTLLG